MKKIFLYDLCITTNYLICILKNTIKHTAIVKQNGTNEIFIKKLYNMLYKIL